MVLFPRAGRAPPRHPRAGQVEEETEMAIELTIPGTGTGPCSLTGMQGEGMTATFR
jgi:hypothetical protein